MNSSRRDFLRTAAFGAAAVLLQDVARAEPAAWFKSVPLGGKLNVPLLGMGTGVKAGNRTNALWRLGEAHFAETVRRAYDEGVRLFDCADTYGSLPQVAKALKDKPRDSYVLVSKIWLHEKGGLPKDEPRADADAVVERFLRETGSDHIDLVQLHCMMDGEWNKKLRKQMDLLAACKQKGQVRAHGVSCHSIAALETAAAEPWVDVVHTRINPFGAKMDGSVDQVVPVLRKIHAAGKGVIGMKLIGEGSYGNDPAKIDEALKFVLGLGCVDALIVGFEQPTQIVDYKARVRKALVA